MYTVIDLFDVFRSELYGDGQLGKYPAAVSGKKQNFSTLPWDHLSRDGLYI